MSVIILSENSEVKASAIPVSSEKEKEKTMTWREVCSKANDIKMYRNNYIICILFFSVPVLCFSRPRETDKSKTKRGEHCEEAEKSI